MKILARLKLPPYNFIAAILLVFLATMIRLLLFEFLGNQAPFVTFFPAVMIAALYGGIWAGLLSTVLSAIATNYFLTAPLYRLSLSSLSDGVAMAIFILSCVMISLISEAMLRARTQLKVHQDQLEGLIEKRTKELKESNEKFSIIFNKSPIPFSLCRMYDSIIEDVNEAWEALFGFSRTESVGKTVIDLGITCDTHERSRLWAEVRKNGAVHEVELTEYKTKNNPSPIMLVNMERLEFGGGEHVLITTQDFTDRKRLDEERQRYNQKILSINRQLEESERNLKKNNADLIAANLDLESFSHSISHDFRNFLNILISMGSILDTYYHDKLDEDGKRCISTIQKTSEEMAHLISSLLKYSSAGQKELKKQMVSISKIALTITDQLRQVHKASKVEIAIEPDLYAKADYDLITIVLSNLVGNAWKFSSKVEHPHIRIGSTVKDSIKTFFVQDNGIGFDKENARQLFLPFKRLQPKSAYQGHGLGLAIAYRIIKHHGGTIWAEGESGKGATFYFTLPDDEGSGQKNAPDPDTLG